MNTGVQTTINVHLGNGSDIRTDIDDDLVYRTIDFGNLHEGAKVSLFFNGIETVDALQAALDEVRASFAKGTSPG